MPLATLIWLFYALVFLFTSSGRLNNWDPLAQLQAATALVMGGDLGVAQHPMPNVPDLWIQSANNKYYEAHDLGGALFLIPAAAVGAVLEGGRHSRAALVQQPPWAARLFGTLEYALLGAWGCYAVYRLCACFYGSRTAFLLSLTFAATTTYWAYTRIAYDILGGCVGVCLLLWYCAEALRRPRDCIRDSLRIGGAAALACLFRFSLTPFVGAGVVGVIFVLRRHWKGRTRLAAMGALLAGLAPTFYYNYVRTQMPLKNAVTGQFPVAVAFQGDLRDGLYGLVFSPNWGLIWFAPVFILLVFLPWAWRKAPIPLRQLLACFLPPGMAYLVVIAKFYNWTGHSGWGPRYLLPLVPILFLGTMMVLTAGWDRYRRPLAAVVALSAFLNLPSMFVNFRAARSAYPGGADTAARSPRQQIAAWQALASGLRGRSTPVLPDAVHDPVRRHAGDFPDLWTARLIRMGDAKKVAGLGIGAFLLGCAAVCLRQILMIFRKSANYSS